MTQREHGIVVTARAQYIPEQSDPAQHRWFFAYRVRILNQGHFPARVLRRHWIISNARGEVEEVEGDGIIGATPWLPPTAAFEYTSFCPLPTPNGMMRGGLAMARDDGQEFNVEIPVFELVSSEELLQ
ncbi:MAG: Co2+/Mg2+ efflux protein ApaG [Myxococcales bacterium]|nr:Co2+/Mg2+ efflux protein ApaG [Myxococcales bacterium]|tara:strand:- start:137 stop:520 length:384 start_codon:yes stop_codon:yes gene_type:complete